MKFKKTFKIILPIFLIFTIVVSIFIYQVGFFYKYYDLVDKYSKKYQIDKNLVFALIREESNFNKNAVSKKGAVGLMQIMPSTAEFICEILNIDDNVDLYDSETNVMLGVRYLKYLFSKFNSEDIVICAYNAGENVVLSWIDNNGKLKKIEYRQTKIYLNKVKYKKQLYKIINKF